MKMTLILGLALTTNLLFSTAQAEDDIMVVPVQRMTLETALTIAKGAVEACREKGIQIGVSVVDRDGHPQVSLRDTIASPITEKIALGKAYTAAMFNVATSQLADRADSAIGRVDGLVMSAGALTITAGGSLLGAVGVSGAPSGVTDEACAQAGLDLVQDDLDFL